MKVILQQEIKKIGIKGQILEVSEGYARNFLFPKKLAIVATDANIHVAKQQQAAAQRKEQRGIDEAKVMASQLNKVEVVIPVKLGEGGKMFGSVTSKDIAEALKAAHGVDLDKRKIELKEAIKCIGEYAVSIKIHSEVDATITVKVKEQV